MKCEGPVSTVPRPVRSAATPSTTASLRSVRAQCAPPASNMQHAWEAARLKRGCCSKAAARDQPGRSVAGFAFVQEMKAGFAFILSASSFALLSACAAIFVVRAACAESLHPA